VDLAVGVALDQSLVVAVVDIREVAALMVVVAQLSTQVAAVVVILTAMPQVWQPAMDNLI
jgi:hypothetical protein